LIRPKSRAEETFSVIFGAKVLNPATVVPSYIAVSTGSIRMVMHKLVANGGQNISIAFIFP